MISYTAFGSPRRSSSWEDECLRECRALLAALGFEAVTPGFHYIRRCGALCVFVRLADDNDLHRVSFRIERAVSDVARVPISVSDEGLKDAIERMQTEAVAFLLTGHLPPEVPS